VFEAYILYKHCQDVSMLMCKEAILLGHQQVTPRPCSSIMFS